MSVLRSASFISECHNKVFSTENQRSDAKQKDALILSVRARVQNRGKLVGATWEQSLPWGQSALAEEVEHASVAISFVVH